MLRVTNMHCLQMLPATTCRTVQGSERGSLANVLLAASCMAAAHKLLLEAKMVCCVLQMAYLDMCWHVIRALIIMAIVRSLWGNAVK